MNLKEKVKNYFKLNGFILDPKASEYLTELIQKIEIDKPENVMEKLVNAFNGQDLKNNKITTDIIQNAVNICRNRNDQSKLFQVIDAFQIPKLKYDKETQKFNIIDPDNSVGFSSLFSDQAADKYNLFQSRYEIIFQRLLRHPINSFKNSIKTIDSLLNSGKKLSGVVVLGLIFQERQAEWCLEDLDGKININLDKANYHKGMVLEGCFVLVEGNYENKILYASTIGMPPLESGVISRSTINSNRNYFGGLPIVGNIKTCSDIEKSIKAAGYGGSIVVLSEIYLNLEKVISKLKILFQGYLSLKPTAFILNGNFLSPDTLLLSKQEKIKLLKLGLRNVIKCFSMFPELALNSHLVFVPGPNDLFQGPTNVLPRPSLSADLLLTEAFDNLPNLTKSQVDEIKQRIILASNPCRITFYNKEIVVFRDRILQKFHRNCVYIPDKDDTFEQAGILDQSATLNDSINATMLVNSETDIGSEHQNKLSLENHIVWTILSQNHLMPLPLHISPVYWKYDNALQLFPVPDFVILSDPTASPFDISVNDSMFVNPPDFSGGENFPFKIIYPLKNKVDICNLNI